MRALALAALLAAIGLVPAPAGAWSKAGHRVSAVIAYRDLASASPDTIEALVAILAAHPAAAAFEARAREEGDSPVARRERLFAEAAQWPDEVRKGAANKSWNHPSWHTVDLPFVPAGVKLATPPADPQSRENLLRALPEQLRILRDAASPPEARAVALCWVLHLVGDLHQPLHTAALFNDAFPAGDAHGNRFWVRPAEGAKPVKLHEFWDGLVGRSTRSSDVLAAATRLRADHPESAIKAFAERPFVDAATFDTWVREESHALARARAYRDGRLAGSAEKREAPVLPAGYEDNARTLAERQLALAGHRLAAVLRQALAAPKPPSTSR